MSLRVAICLLAVLRAAQCDSWHKVHFKKVDALAARAVASIKGHEGHEGHEGHAAVCNEGDLFAEQGFWFSHFTIGASQDLEILIDTGSSDAILNPGVYRASSSSHDTGRPFRISYDTTNPDGSGNLTASGEIYRDVISQHGADLTVHQQALGDIRKPTTPPTFPRDGLIGYAGGSSSALGASPFIHSLCDQGSLSSCRFGLALKTDRTGELYYGTVPADLFAGSLVTVPIQDEWAVFGALTLNGKTVQPDVKLITDSGTTVIFGPTEQVSNLFQKAGIQAVRTQGGIITGYYKCSAPPKMGFSLGGRNFNILPEALAFANKGDNCTTSVRGSDAFGNNWLVGQPFFQGRYIDHSIGDGTMGFADLK